MTLRTERLILEPVTLSLVEAVLAGDRRLAEELSQARFPSEWPGPAVIERAFKAYPEAIRAAPDTRLWGDRLMITHHDERRVIGSVIFHGCPENGIAEVGYGVERGSQGQGLATEGTRACVEWALTQPNIQAVRATTFSWHRASVRVLEKVGMHIIGSEEHELMGELLLFEVRK
jgi:RimJ/RimL family protein N-acetyltransferase